MARSVFATAGTPKGRFSGLHRTNGMHFSAAHKRVNSTLSAGSDRPAQSAVAFCLSELSIRTQAESPDERGSPLLACRRCPPPWVEPNGTSPGSPLTPMTAKRAGRGPASDIRQLTDVLLCNLHETCRASDGVIRRATGERILGPQVQHARIRPLAAMARRGGTVGRCPAAGKLRPYQGAR